MGILNIIRQCIRDGLYYLTEHAVAEADEDDLEIYDVENVLLSGNIRKTWPREKKFEIMGSTLDGRVACAVCRLTPGGKVRIITVYEEKSKS